jgi:hypothetical protein
MDAEGTRTHLPRILKVAELRAQGKSREEIQRFVADAFAKGIFQPPSRPGVDYMLSTENLVPNEKGIVVPFPPHVMFYAPYLTNSELGVDRTDLGPDGNPHAATFVAGEGTPHALIIVPVALHTGPAHPLGNTPQKMLRGWLDSFSGRSTGHAGGGTVRLGNGNRPVDRHHGRAVVATTAEDRLNISPTTQCD